MGVEIKDHSEAIAFLQGFPGADAIDWLAKGLDRLAQTGKWDAAWRVFQSEDRRLQGIMVIAPETAGEADLRAVIAANNERALRDLLCSIPRGKTLQVSSVGAWTLRTIVEFLDSSVLQEQPDISCYLGIKRGSGSGRVRPRTIDGKKDPVIEEFRRLDSLKAKIEQSRIVVEGELPVGRALRDGLPVDKVLYTSGFEEDLEGKRILADARAGNVGLYAVSAGLMAAVTDIHPVPRVLASVHVALPDASEFHLNADSIILITDDVANPDNLGMVLRTADAAGVDGVVVIGKGASPFHKNCIRSARGAVGRIPIFQCRDDEGFLRSLRDRGFRIIGSSAKAKSDLYDLDLKAPVAFIIGSESEGMRKSVADLCTDSIRIPMASGQSSLNVGVAAGVMLFEWRRKRMMSDE